MKAVKRPVKRPVKKRPSGIPASSLPRQGVTDATTLLRSSAPADRENRLIIQPAIAPTVTGKPLKLTKNRVAAQRTMVKKQAAAVKQQAAVAKVQQKAALNQQAYEIKSAAIAQKAQARQELLADKSALKQSNPEAKLAVAKAKEAKKVALIQAKQAVDQAKYEKKVTIIEAKKSVAKAEQAKKQAVIEAKQALATGKLSAKQALAVDKTLAARDLAVRKAQAKADLAVGTMAAKQRLAEGKLDNKLAVSDAKRDAKVTGIIETGYTPPAPKRQKNAPGAHKREALRQAAAAAAENGGTDQAFEPDQLMPDSDNVAPEIEVGSDQGYQPDYQPDQGYQPDYQPEYQPEQSFEPDQGFDPAQPGFEDQQQMTEESPVMDGEFTEESPVLEDGYVEEGTYVEEDGEMLPSDEEFTGETQSGDLNSEQYVMDAFSGLVTDYGAMGCDCDGPMSGYLDSYAGRGRGSRKAARPASRRLAVRQNRSPKPGRSQPPVRRMVGLKVKSMHGYLDSLDTFAAFADAPVAVPSPTVPPATGVFGFIKEAANTYLTVKNQAAADKAASKRKAVVEKTKLVQVKATQNRMASQATMSTGLLALGAVVGVAAIFLMVSKNKS